tara:strand:+ start:183 stop:437 length:255 start_codon:yes stop_codon:yes gene_type:complete
VKVGDLVRHKSLGLGIVTKMMTFEEISAKYGIDPMRKDLFPLFEIKTLDVHYYNPYDDVIETKRDYILDQDQIAEFVELLNESR